MEARFVHTSVNILFSSDPGEREYEHKMVPYIVCKDCDYKHFVHGPDDVYFCFRIYHTCTRGHAMKIQARLIPNSRTVKKAAFLVSNNDRDRFHDYMSQLTDGTNLVDKLVDDYYDCCQEPIFALATREDEMDILAYLLESTKRISNKLIADLPKGLFLWARSIGSVLISKMLVLKMSADQLFFCDDTGITLFDKWITEARLTEAVELVEFVSRQEPSCRPPLGLACVLGHHEIVAAMLQAGADPNASNSEYDSPLSCALRSAKTNMRNVELLLEAGARVDRVDKRAIRGLRKRTLPMSYVLQSDAADTLAILERYGVDIHP